LTKEIFKFSNTYTNLPSNFYERVNPIPVKNPKLIEFNSDLSRFLNIDPKKINAENGKLFFSGNIIPDGAEPIATAYAGHQFGNFVPQLGDGRAILMGELFTIDGNRVDFQLKGSGKTPFSRDGDGRSPLGPVIREYILSEAIHNLGIKSTRALAIVSTGETVLRETPNPGGILTRIASSHIRVGTFEFFFYKRDFKSLKKLADYTIKRHFEKNDIIKNYSLLLKNVIYSQAKLISKWMSVGFIHGVMNTDNTSISGETIDYGPCAFMDHFDPKRVFSYIDFQGRYSYMNQGKIILWNLSKFAESILPILNDDINKAKKIAVECLEEFPDIFKDKWLNEMRKKFGFKKKKNEDIKIINDFFELIRVENLDFTLSFRNLSNLLTNKNEKEIKSQFKDKRRLDTWISSWKERLKYENLDLLATSFEMEKVNPLYIPRNHLVESVINAAVQNNDFSKMKELLKVIRRPFSKEFFNKKYKLPPRPDQIISNTFCGT